MQVHRKSPVHTRQLLVLTMQSHFGWPTCHALASFGPVPSFNFIPPSPPSVTDALFVRLSLWYVPYTSSERRFSDPLSSGSVYTPFLSAVLHSHPIQSTEPPSLSWNRTTRTTRHPVPDLIFSSLQKSPVIHLAHSPSRLQLQAGICGPSPSTSSQLTKMPSPITFALEFSRMFSPILLVYLIMIRAQTFAPPRSQSIRNSAYE